MKPLFFEEPSNEKLLNEKESYLWGNAFLVKPITSSGVSSTQMYFPKSTARQLMTKPSVFDLRHSVTKYEIYVKLKNSNSSSGAKSNWFDLESIRKINHSSLMTKILKKLE